MCQTSFHKVNTNNASSGLWEKFILINLASKYVGKNRHQNVGSGRGGHPWLTQLYMAMYIQVNDPILNRNLGKYQLPYIWDWVLQDMLALHLL